MKIQRIWGSRFNCEQSPHNRLDRKVRIISKLTAISVNGVRRVWLESRLSDKVLHQ